MVEQVKFVGVDHFSRPVFKSLSFPRNFFGSCDKLFHPAATKEDVRKAVTVSDLTFFGNSLGCEPEGTPAGNIEINWEAE